MLSRLSAYLELKKMMKRELALAIAFVLLVSSTMIVTGIGPDDAQTIRDDPQDPYVFYGYIYQYGEATPVPNCNVTVQWWNTSANYWDMISTFSDLGGAYMIDILNYSDNGTVFCNVTFNPVYGDLGYNTTTIDMIGSPGGRHVDITCDTPEPPFISLTVPEDAETDVSLDQDIIITFSETMNPATFAFTCAPNPGGWTESWSANDTILTLGHNDFAVFTTYTTEVISGEDLEGSPLTDGPVPNPWTFTTGNFSTQPLLEITKSAPAMANPGETIMYKIDYQNIDTGTAYDVIITETYPAQVTYVDANPWPDIGNNVWLISNLPPGAGGTIYINVTVNPSANGTLVNSVEAEYEDFFGVPYVPVSNLAYTDVIDAYVTISKTAPATARQGEAITYTISYENIGTDWAYNVIITETYPMYVTFIGAVPAPSMGNNVWMIPPLSPGASGSITITVQVDASTPLGTLLVNEVNADYENDLGAPYQSNDSATTLVVGPLMQLTKDGPLTAAPEDIIVYWINFTNLGNDWAYNVVITDAYPANVTFISAIPAPDNPGAGDNEWNVGSLAPAGSGSIQITVQVSPAVEGVLTNWAFLDHENGIGLPYVQIMDFVTTSITTGTPDLCIYEEEITISNASPSLWEEVLISANVHNIGNANATCTVSVYMDNMTVENLLYRESEVLVPCGDSVVISHYWTADVTGNHSIIVDITDSEPSESILTNNMAFSFIYVNEPQGKLKVKASSDKQRYVLGVDMQAEIIVKVTYQGQLIEGANVLAWVIDPGNANASVSMSEASPGIYTGTYTFTNASLSGIYRIKVVASKPGYENGENNEAKDKFFLKSPVIDTPEVSSVMLSSYLPDQGADVVITADVTHYENVDSIHSKVISHKGRPNFVLPLYDDGTHSDAATGDGVFTNLIPTADMSGAFSVDIVVNNVTHENVAALVVGSTAMTSLETFTGLQTSGNSLNISSALTNTTLNITTIADISDICFSVIEHRTLNEGKSIEIIPSSNVNVVMLNAYIELSYSEEDIPVGDNESNMRIYLYNIYTEELESCLPGGVDIHNDLTWGETEHFSNFEFIIDTIAPAHRNEMPASDGYAKSARPTISVEVTDESLINLSAIKLYVSGFSVMYDVVEIDYGYLVSYTPAADFTEGDVIPCRIVAEDMLANELDWTWSFTVLHSFGIQLESGWNLISLPLVQVDASILEVLYSIDGKWDIVQYFDPLDAGDPWKTYATFKPDSLNDLRSINHRMAVWIHATEACTLTVHGQEPTSTNIPLYSGWNLVGYPSRNENTTVANSLWGTGADAVQVCDTSEPYNLREVGPEYVLQPGEGYWVHVPFDSSWIVNW